MIKVKRYEIADYLNTAEAGETEDYHLLGAGVKALDESPNANVESEAFVNDKTESSSVESYKPSFSFDSYLVKDEAAILNLYAVGHDQQTNEAAERDYIRVDLYDVVGEASDNTYRARKFRVAVEVSENSGEGTKPVSVKGNLNQIGDMIPGTFNTTTKIFTADA